MKEISAFTKEAASLLPGRTSDAGRFSHRTFYTCKIKNIHTCIDSSGIAFQPDHALWMKNWTISPALTDLVMLDIKHIDPEKHRELTAQPNDKILAFAEYLSEKGVPVWIRHVVVPPALPMMTNICINWATSSAA